MKKYFSYIEALLAGLFKKIEKTCQCDPVELTYIRVLLGFFFLLVYPPKWQWIAEAPSSFFNPPILSFANLTNGFPPSVFFPLAEIVVIVLYVFISIGFYTRMSVIIATLLFVSASNYAYSFGKIDHSILLGVTLGCLAFTNAGTTYAIRKDRAISMKTQLNSLSFLGICIAFGMFSAGFKKALRWIDFDLSTSGFLSWYYPNYFMYDNEYLLAPWVSFIPSLIIEIGEYLVVILELSGFFFLTAGKNYWRIWLISLCIFHLVNHLTLNIPFTGHIIVYGVFLFPPIFMYIKKKQKITIKKLAPIGILFFGILVIVRLLESILSQSFFQSEALSIYGDLLLWLIMIFASAIAYKHNNLAL